MGVHLILATQNPSGVVNDQIWTNSRFKLALKVQNEADSKEIIKTGDAAFITQPGRAYLQVGNNEIYELFQSAWSGATYSEEHVEVKDDRVYIINELGQGELVNGDLSEGGEQTQIKDTQLDVTVRYLAEEFTKSGMKPVEKPWLPSLSDQIVSPYATLPDREKSPEERALDLKIPLGIVDIPEEQSLGLEIEDVSIRGIKEGQTPFLILGEASKGKTNIIRVILNQLCGDNIVYLFDNRKLELYDYQSRDGVQYIEKDEFDTFADELMSSCKIRMQEYKKELVMNPRLSMAEYLKNQPKEYIVIDDGEIFIDWAGEYVKRYGNFLQEAAEAGVSIILAIQPAKLKGFDEISKWLKSSMNGLLLSGQGSINVFSVVSMKEYPAFGDGLLFTDGTYEKIKLPKSIER